MTHWLITGAGGMLGQDLVIALEQVGDNVAGLTHRDLDITDEADRLAVWRALTEPRAHDDQA